MQKEVEVWEVREGHLTKIKVDNNILLCYPIKEADATHKKEINEEQQNTKKKYRPKNAIGFSNKYRMWVKEEHYDIVKKALNAWTSATKNIHYLHDETQLKKQRIRSVLDYMIDEGDAIREYSSKKRTYIYAMT